jgi:hypothetical protein
LGWWRFSIDLRWLLLVFCRFIDGRRAWILVFGSSLGGLGEVGGLIGSGLLVRGGLFCIAVFGRFRRLVCGGFRLCGRLGLWLFYAISRLMSYRNRRYWGDFCGGEEMVVGFFVWFWGNGLMGGRMGELVDGRWIGLLKWVLLWCEVDGDVKVGGTWIFYKGF